MLVALAAYALRRWRLEHACRSRGVRAERACRARVRVLPASARAEHIQLEVA